MKVVIGPYRNFFGVYQLADKIPFISEETAERIGDRLSKTWMDDFLKWIDNKKERKINIRIDPYDTWNMNHTLALIILPMLKQLKESNHGSQMVDDEDVPLHMRHSHVVDYYDPWIHYKWEWVMNEMIWTFEQLLDDDWEDQYTIEEGEIDWDDYPEDEGKDVKPVRWKKEYVIDYKGLNAHHDRIANGLRLFGKYYQGLWD